MTCSFRSFAIPVVCAACLLADSASASVITGYVQDWEGWQSATGTYTTVDFTDIPPMTLMTDQYQDAGVIFSVISGSFGWSAYAPPWFPQDGHGVQSFSVVLELTFTQPMHAIGMHVGIATRISLLSGDTPGSIFAQLPFEGFTTSFDNFTGLVSETAFSKVWISTDDSAQILLDNLYFSTIPAPSGLGLLCMAMMGGRGRRRG